ncbi:MAG: hypothetical protein ACD_52C00256G0004 [uncultured bacterium]|uniref:Uncharacterized protein n=1 Tax=Candidatus Woesebacteria bacterium RIFCSPHIGHO2_12_FULL_41_24 TaxID=1802510 RepID=A0A1F8AQP5_9BACT|nr:MAG: hypothetical protein ACD_52C00256G0004 [uncultured bacterium]OGM15094.1 MAG: hypothetical protein A2W15_06335 [Candidatus Woesebacteria bacterium RBG_16_41_13]OGM28669.1 MAG: hypothetical protein A2873_05630 [Candidatus Woesebacteria bacterium RIFCSPHIGHO2_01_FULL_42_80]OGM34455.1 MAG: hypothetical protein A3D84_04560 [Candidatus Woesebacteria bacterium RIFCSPHIGHO2_02_FULL_42_20]OGM54093.1 MAG: hypothetical protein A3E44_02715 [Candidatus Woesebacteria bacterium RIFCSPHIGHO2_12_FULL_41
MLEIDTQTNQVMTGEFFGGRKVSVQGIARLSRRRFVGLTLATVLAAACTPNPEQIPPRTQEYLDYVRTHVVELANGELVPNINFGEERFTALDIAIDKPIANIVSTQAEPTVYIPPDDPNDIFQTFNQALNLSGAWILSEYVLNNSRGKLTFYGNKKIISLTLNPGVIGELYTWIKTVPQIEPHLYKGIIDQHILLGSFDVNPLYPEVKQSVTGTNDRASGVKTSFTAINLKVQTGEFNGPDNALVTELMNGILTGMRRLEQEILANSISTAYSLAARP